MKDLYKGVIITLLLSLLLGVGYILLLRGFAFIAGPDGGNAEMTIVNGKRVGASNIGQQFSDMKYFWGRPSATGYNAEISGGSNKGTSNKEYLNLVKQRTKAFMKAHPYLSLKDVPSEMVTASGSGLDPDISPYAAKIQVQRVAAARGLSMESVVELVDNHVKKPWLGLFGTAKVNVLDLNIALDKLNKTDGKK